MNALKGKISARTFKEKASINGGSVYVLIDSGSANNFIQPTVPKDLKLPIFPIDLLFVVSIGNGHLTCTRICKEVISTVICSVLP